MKPPDERLHTGIKFDFSPPPALAARYAMLALLLFFIIGGAAAQTVEWSDTFTQGQAPTAAQCENWNNFRAQLAGKGFSSVTISGTFDAVGKTISDPLAATALATLLSAGTPGVVTSGVQRWAVGNCGPSQCGGGLSIALAVDGSTTACDCSDRYAIRPNTQGNQWGGINTASCNGPTQTMQLVFRSGVTVVADGPTTLCPGESVTLTAKVEGCAGPYTYLWSNQETTESITVTEAGRYAVTVTGDNCSGTSTPVEILVLNVSVDAGEPVTYCDEPVQLTATGVSSPATTRYCLFDAPGGADDCSFPDTEDVCTGSLFYTAASFSATSAVSNPTELRYNIYYSAFTLNARFILKLNGQEIGSFTETNASGACDTKAEGKFPKTFSFSSSQFIQYWINGAENTLTVEIAAVMPGILLAGVTAEVISVNGTYSWSPSAGLSNSLISNPLASPAETTLYTVTYTGNGCTVTDQVEVKVDCNTAPVAVCKPLIVSAGADCQAIVEAADFDGGSTSNSGGPLTFAVAPAGPYAVGETGITLTVTDENGESSSCSTTITVNDTSAPVITTTDLVLANDAGACSATVVPDQPEATDNCGIASITNDQADDIFLVGETIVTWTVTDIHGNAQTATQKITVTNDDPLINSVTASADIVEINTPVSLAVAFADNNAASASIDWGDLSVPDVLEGPENNFVVTHVYAAAGTYAVTVTLTDQCEATTSYVYESVTVFEKQSGYVKGNGWFYSKPGYYLANRAAEGKAQFVFEAQYPDTGGTPVGHSSFRFRAGRLTFQSAAFSLLVIDGQAALLTGSGQVNGDAGYGILISMVDFDARASAGTLTFSGKKRKGKGKDKQADRIRVKIWDAAGVVVYDTQHGAGDDEAAITDLGGGSIKIGTGAETFSASLDEAIASHFGGESTSVYPNPFVDQLQIQFNASSEDAVHVQLMDLTGKTVYSARYEVSSDGSYSLELPDDDNGTGIFILKIRQGKRVEFIRLVRK